ncbi:MAG: hypothetical protein OXG51_15455 [Gammaproteobacteria bacterium]|nr:hypothetical protein [Gammaproteobacteria bacterium]
MEIQLADGINILAVLGVGFWLHKELAGLRERMAKLEGRVGGLENTVSMLASNVGVLMMKSGEHHADKT